MKLKIPPELQDSFDRLMKSAPPKLRKKDINFLLFDGTDNTDVIPTRSNNITLGCDNLVLQIQTMEEKVTHFDLNLYST